MISAGVARTLERRGIMADLTPFSSPKSFRLKLEDGCQYDLIFLDIQMPGINGIDLGTWLREKKSCAAVVYVSSREDMVFDALTTQPFGFVRKKCFFEDITAVIDRFLAQYNENGNQPSILVQQNGNMVRFKVNEVVYIEGGRRNQSLYLQSGGEPVLIRETMAQLTEVLTPMGFLRIHKGFLVNSQYISAFQGCSVLLTTGIELPLSRRNGQAVKVQYMELLQGEGGVIL